ncbi:hypothetical protein [Flagellimonas olearia]|uniref:Lipoprotein n=1 Tax=Flagellimonas olearia TaxID=552546 RepID=A0A444VN96_9FLAO|nr:hypothetical protein [Allomuricauda olearia]RYC52150.1 hypothetical protein DN53_09700 [Allomuricauda olearia]
MDQRKMYWAIVKMAILLLVLTSCEKEVVQTNDSQPIAKEQPDTLRMIKLGKKLENPYSVKNMRKAWQILKEKSKVSKEGEIETTHWYVKFKPKTEEELSILKADSTLTLYDTPLDFEIDESGDFYHDPEVSIDQPTYQYASVRFGYSLPKDIEYELLEELFIPDEEADLEGGMKTNFASKQVIYQLVDESLRLTGNLDDEEIENPLASKSRWRPSGTIKVYDHVVNDHVGVSGVKVWARRWFTTYRGFTNRKGKYTCNGRFRRKANYSIKWDRYEFSIRSGTYGQAMLIGPKKRGDWNVNLGRSSSKVVNDRQQYYALIHQGAMDYYYGNRFGLTSPPRNSFFKRQLKIATQLKNDRSSYVKARRIWFGNDISLMEWGSKSDKVYGTIVHELAHAAHREVDKNAYNAVVWDAWSGPCTSFNGCSNPGPTGKNRRRLLETWASTVEVTFVLHRYRSYFKKPNYNYDSEINLQFQKTLDKPYYTSAGYDMIDDVNQRNIYGSHYPIDRVQGYTIKQLEGALVGAKSWNQWRDNIKNRYNNTTEKYLDELFNNWKD